MASNNTPPFVMDSRTSSSATDESTSSNALSDHRTNSEIFLQNMGRLVDTNDVLQMVDLQKQMMLRYEKTNEMLLNFNVLSSNRYQTTALEFKKHTQTLLDMKKDLDLIFKRIRKLKANLNSQFPDAFCQSMESLREDDVDDSVTPKMSVSDSVDIKVIHEVPEPDTEAASAIGGSLR